MYQGSLRSSRGSRARPDTLLAPATVQQYTKPLRDWWNFCQTRYLSPFTPTAGVTLEFLATILKSAGSYSKINTARSAISLISSNAIGENPLIKRFCKGVSTSMLQRPKYEYVWNPAPVIRKLASDFPHQNLSLERLTRKLVMLLALSTGQRCQTLAAIKISQITFEENQALIRIPDKLKTSAPGRHQPLLYLPKFEDHKELCVVNLLISYNERTKDIRPPTCDSLLIALNRPHTYRCSLRYKPNSIGVFDVTHYACECANGRRTIGCCSNVAAIIYYLSYARYLSKIFEPVEILSDNSR
ncbi:hypothetical protein ALC57_10144 [Trachymyrmex cornetzi]|uniref:Tyr recombinase domain-containing protein n=1 Tax=Trachymyrmex cornetzi TaxID=471704 RepID=A0A151J4M2_9HYME|nr:hypothetical protein ALC57_10144 [Trachymyrmex cornetzi]